MDEHGDAQILGSLVEGIHPRFIEVVMLVGRIELQPPETFIFHPVAEFAAEVGIEIRVDIAKGDQSLSPLAEVPNLLVGTDAGSNRTLLRQDTGVIDTFGGQQLLEPVRIVVTGY